MFDRVFKSFWRRDLFDACFELSGACVLSEDDVDRSDEGKKEAKWKSGKTSMSALSKEERKRRLGLVPSDEELERMKKKGKNK